MKGISIALATMIGSTALSDVIVPVRTIRAGEIIISEDLTVHSDDIKGAVSTMRSIIGQEARIALYAGRPIWLQDVSPPALINRNELVMLIFVRGSLRIATEGRALGRGAVGDSIRAMNMVSRMTVTGRVLMDGTIEVQ